MQITDLLDSVHVIRYKHGAKLDDYEFYKNFEVFNKELHKITARYSDDVIDYATYVAEREALYDEYVEMNPYYRTLMGLPPLDEAPVDTIIIPAMYIDSDKDKNLVELTLSERRRLVNSLHMDYLLKLHPEKQYLKFISRELDIVDIRNAEPYDIIWWDKSVDGMIDFVLEYNNAKEHFNNGMRNETFENIQEYYESAMTVYLLFSTGIATSISSVMGQFDLDNYSEEEIINLLLQYGFESSTPNRSFYISLLNKIRTIIDFKGSNELYSIVENLTDDDFEISKYVMVKRLIKTDPLEFDVVFLRIPYHETDVTKYIKQERRIVPYGDMVFLDERWDTHNSSHDSFKSEVIAKDFNTVESKYIDINFAIDLTRNTIYMSSFFANMAKYSHLIKNSTDGEKYIKIQGMNFTPVTIVAYLNALIFRKSGLVDDIPTSANNINAMMGLNISADVIQKARNILIKTPPALHDKLLLDKLVSIDDLDTYVDSLSDGGKFSAFLQLMNDITAFHDNLEQLHTEDLQDLGEGVYVESHDSFGAVRDVYNLLLNTKYTKDWFGGESGTGYSETYSDFIFDEATRNPELKDISDRLIYLNDFSSSDILSYEIKKIVEGLQDYVVASNGIDSSLELDAIKPILSNFRNKEIVKFLMEVITYYKAYTVDTTNSSMLSVGGALESLYTTYDILMSVETIEASFKSECVEVGMTSSFDPNDRDNPLGRKLYQYGETNTVVEEIKIYRRGASTHVVRYEGDN